MKDGGFHMESSVAFHFYENFILAKTTSVLSS